MNMRKQKEPASFRYGLFLRHATRGLRSWIGILYRRVWTGDPGPVVRFQCITTGLMPTGTIRPEMETGALAMVMS